LRISVEAEGTTDTVAWRFWQVSLQVTPMPLYVLVALAMSSPTFLGDCPTVRTDRRGETHHDRDGTVRKKNHSHCTLPTVPPASAVTLPAPGSAINKGLRPQLISRLALLRTPITKKNLSSAPADSISCDRTQVLCALCSDMRCELAYMCPCRASPRVTDHVRQVGPAPSVVQSPVANPLVADLLH
jgi:hypothetical protein